MERAPSLSFERVLLIHDPKTETEHFIREVAFRGGQDMFGFVVPTPTKPEVFKVKESPFPKLEAMFPFQPPSRGGDEGSGNKGAPGGGSRAPGVVILDIKRIGSFTAFVLKANDAGALDKWLKDNKLGSSPENDKWLAEYVKRGFYYVAFRYEPSKDKSADGSLRAETVRISFKTPVAYYPYREPQHDKATDGARAVAMWLVAPAPLVPVALAKESGKDVWVRPFAEGNRRINLPGSFIQDQLGADEKKLLDANTNYVVQPLEDQKVTRTGYGDTVFLPEAGVPEPQRARAEELVKSLLGPSSGGSK